MAVISPTAELPRSMRAELFWLGLTPDGDPRVAFLTPQSPGWPDYRDWGSNVVTLHRVPSPAPTPRYALPGIAEALTMAEVRETLDAISCGRLSISLLDPVGWTAQEVFDLCATRTCSLEPHSSTCWDDAHPSM